MSEEVSVLKNQEVMFAAASGHWVVARRDYIDPQTKGGLYLPENARAVMQKEVATGTVLCVGPGRVLPDGKRETQPCHGGDRIVWSRYGERVIQESEGGDIVAIPFQEVIGVVK